MNLAFESALACSRCASGRQVCMRQCSCSQIVDDRRPIQLRHPQRIAQHLGASGESCSPARILRTSLRGALQRTGDLANAVAFGEAPLDLGIAIHRQLPPRHGPLPFGFVHDGTGQIRSQGGSAPVGPMRRNRLGPFSGNKVGPIPGNRVGSMFVRRFAPETEEV